eukprot:NODE_995_length_2762_cov_0.259106.p1 type:complete len:223 gc:universal NODE_995_length_2762_cov_0.259106:1646-978(-)
MCQTGANRANQIQINLDTAEARCKDLRYCSTFEGAADENGLIRIFSSKIIPLLENGIKIHMPERHLANKVNTFINRKIRSFTGSAQSTNNFDLHAMFNFTDFKDRWRDFYTKYSNHNIKRKNQNQKGIKYFPKVKFSFFASKKLLKLNSKSKATVKLIKKQIPFKPLNNCPKCHNTHGQPVNCFLKELFQVTSQLTIGMITDDQWQNMYTWYQYALNEEENS